MDSPERTTMIGLERVSKRFGHGDPAVDDVSLSIGAG